MVTAARLRWACNQLAMGRQAAVRLNSHPDKLVMHVILSPKFDVHMKNNFLISTLEAAIGSLPDTCAADHGHQSSSGSARFSIVFKPVPLVAPRPLANDGEEDNLDIDNSVRCDDG